VKKSLPTFILKSRSSDLETRKLFHQRKEEHNPGTRKLQAWAVALVCRQDLNTMLGMSSSSKGFLNQNAVKLAEDKNFQSQLVCAQLFCQDQQVCEPRKFPEGGHWAKAKTCSFLHERCNYSHVTLSNWAQPSF
jgi:hypothetical protein